jgi:hypothetical protein
MKIIKTYALDVPKGHQVISIVKNGTAILITNGDELGFIKIPNGEWKILTVEEGVIHLLPKSKEIAIKEGWII